MTSQITSSIIPAEVSGLQTTAEIPWDRFILLAGEPFTGKSTAAASFPNALFLDFDNKVPRGCQTIPFHNADFCDSLPRARRANKILPPNKRDALTEWIEKNCGKLPPSTTIILDSLTSVDTWFHTQTEDVEKVQAGADGGQLYGKKLKYFSTLFEVLKMFGCRVIINVHLVPVFSKDQATGKVKPLIGGTFAERIPGYCTSVIRAHHKVISNETTYYWRIKPDAIFNSNVPFPSPVTDLVVGPNIEGGAYGAMTQLISTLK